MKPCIPIRLLMLWVGISCCLVARSNNILVSNISLTARNKSAQTVLVQFNLSWDNSWRTSTAAPFNWDAAWVFVKYKVGNGDWKHATLATSGHTIPSGATSTQSDGSGMFIYRSTDGTGTFSPSGIQLRWNYGTNGVANDSKITVKVFAIEMVYHPPSGFQVGSGGINNGEFRRANDVTATAPASTFTITGTNPTVQGNSSSASPTNLAAYTNLATDLTGTSTASLAANFPTGFDAFYAMKYEISQQQYVNFLNTLTYPQQAARTATAPSSSAGTGALISDNSFRNGIDIQTAGIDSYQPAVYACNLNGNATYNDADDGQHIACNFLSWGDLAAYLDWAALRPITELEFEKACRGTVNPVANEYPWGNTTATAVTGLSNTGYTNEIASASSNIVFNGSFSGPVRSGMLATSGTSRTNSGAGYYGAMDLGGNLWERCVTIGNSAGRNFSSTHGNGTIASGGDSDVSGWPNQAGSGIGIRGGGWGSINYNASTSGRNSAVIEPGRQNYAGGRGARTSSAGIVTDGLVLWLDAGIPSSYPTSGTTWTDLSGNNNNGTLTNGPTFNSANGGSIVFDGVNDYTDLGSNFTYPIFTISLWVNAGSSQVQYADIFDNNHTGFRNFVLQQNNNNTNQYAFGVSDASGGISSSGSINLTANTWTNISITFTPSDRVIAYINGTFHSQGALANNRNILYQSQVLRLATWSAGGRNWNGRIASFISYNRVLSSAEILQNFNAQKALFGL